MVSYQFENGRGFAKFEIWAPPCVESTPNFMESKVTKIINGKNMSMLQNNHCKYS